MVFVKICWTITLLASCVSALMFIVFMTSANGAPQEAAGAAMALVVAVIPYIYTRSAEALAKNGVTRVEITSVAEGVRTGRVEPPAPQI